MTKPEKGTSDKRIPLVITGPELASILTKIAEGLSKQSDDDVFQVRYDAKQRLGQSEPTLSVQIIFDPKTFVAKTVTITSAKKTAKEWNLAHGIAQKK